MTWFSILVLFSGCAWLALLDRRRQTRLVRDHLRRAVVFGDCAWVALRYDDWCGYDELLTLSLREVRYARWSVAQCFIASRPWEPLSLIPSVLRQSLPYTLQAIISNEWRRAA